MYATPTFIPVRTIVLMGLLSSCQQTTQTSMPVGSSSPGTLTAVSATPTDVVPWVSYEVSDLASFAQPRSAGTLRDEAQGEAVGWAIDGSGYYTTSEKVDATPLVLLFYYG